MKMFANVKFLPLYPLFFALYPLLALLGFNIDETAFNVVWRPLFLIAAGVLILMVLFFLPLRNWHRAALLTTILVLLFFTYGHFYSYLKTVEVFGFIVGRHRQLLPLWAVLGALGAWWAIRRLKNPQQLAPVLNLISIFLLVYPVFQSVSYVISESRARQALSSNREETASANSSLGYAPDIYYIILDAYGRADTLQTVFDYDNSEFWIPSGPGAFTWRIAPKATIARRSYRFPLPLILIILMSWSPIWTSMQEPMTRVP
jgi:hypothetical protein